MSPRSKEQNMQIKDERREQLLLAALKVFSRKGLAAAKIGDIAAEAGLSHGLVYHYFDSKDEIFTELVGRAVGGSSYVLLEVETLPLEPIEKIRRVTSTVLGAIGGSEDTAYYFFLMVQAYVSNAGPEEALKIVQNSGVPTEVMLRIVREGQAKGQVGEGDPADYVSTYWAAIQGLAVYKIAMGERFKMPDGELLVGMFEKKS